MGDLRWGVEQRLEFIEFRLYWEGGLNRSDIVNYFGVSVPQSSKDLSQYQEIAPNNILYDRRQKRYFATNTFEPKFLNPDADRYLNYLRSISDQLTEKDETWLSQIPAYEALPLPRQKSIPEALRTLIAAVRDNQSIEIRYQSLSNPQPDPAWRWVTPHAFAYDGHRWHVRAFCHIASLFKDFLLPRVLATRTVAPATARMTREHDEIWNTIISVGLKPNPSLTDEQQRIIARDYEMQDGRLYMKVRLALLSYLLMRLNIDARQETLLAREHHIVLSNRFEIHNALERARGFHISRSDT